MTVLEELKGHAGIEVDRQIACQAQDIDKVVDLALGKLEYHPINLRLFSGHEDKVHKT